MVVPDVDEAVAAYAGAGYTVAERWGPPFAILAGNPAFGALRTLKVRPAHAWDEPGRLPLDWVLPLFRSQELRSLEHLHLHASSMGDRGCEELLRSGVLARLKTLDLAAYWLLFAALAPSLMVTEARGL